MRGLGRRGIELLGNDIDWYRTRCFSKFFRCLATLNPETEEHNLLDKLIELGSQIQAKSVILAPDSLGSLSQPFVDD